MVKKENRRRTLTCNFSSTPQTIREEIRGKSESNVKRLHDVNEVLRLKHLQKIALWAGGEASSPSFGAYFGYQLASSREALGIKTNGSSIVSCQRVVLGDGKFWSLKFRSDDILSVMCEALLQPGFNCKVRIEKNASEGNCKSNKSLLQNNSVYTCQFCYHKNIERGSLKGYLKSLTASKLICKSECGTKTVNKTYVSNAILGTLKRNLQKVTSVSQEKMLLSAKRDNGSLRTNHLVSNPESGMDAAGRAVPVESHIPVALLTNQMQETASASVKSESQLHDPDPVLETDRSEKDGVDMQETPLQDSANPSLGRRIGESSAKKRKRRKCSGDTRPVQPESSTSLLGQENTNSMSSRQRMKSSWSSLKELIHEEQSKRERYGDPSGMSIPFSL